MRLLAFILIWIVGKSNIVFAQSPINDNCSSAQFISISGNGYGFGKFKTDTFNLNNATLQTGEYFPSIIANSALDKKSIWFKFSLPTKRGISIELKQPGNLIPIKDVGFTIYKTDTCLPSSGAILRSKLTPLNQFGSTTNPCCEPGEYLIQVSCKYGVSGVIFLELKSDLPYNISNIATTGKLDNPDSAFHFNTIPNGVGTLGYAFNVGCFSINDSVELLKKFGSNYKEYYQTAWLTFKTDSFSDFLSIEIGDSTNLQFVSGSKIGYQLYKGNISKVGLSSLIQADSSRIFDWDKDRLPSNNYWKPVAKLYPCFFSKNTEYTIKLIFHKSFDTKVYVKLNYSNTKYIIQSSEPTITGVNNQHKLGILKSNDTIIGAFNCNTQFKNTGCGTVNPLKGFSISNKTYALTQWYSFIMPKAGDLQIEFKDSTTGQNIPIIGKIYKDTLTYSCIDIDSNQLLGHFKLISNYNQSYLGYCLPAGQYLIQIIGLDTQHIAGVGSSGHFGRPYQFIYRYNKSPETQFSLSFSGNVDSINAFKDMKHGIPYYSIVDSLSCKKTILPKGYNNLYDRGIYRILKIGDAEYDGIADTGILIFKKQSILYSSNQFIFKGNASKIATDSNSFSYNDSLIGLEKMTSYEVQGYRPNVCVEPGSYTYLYAGDQNSVGFEDKTDLMFLAHHPSHNKWYNPFNFDTLKLAISQTKNTVKKELLIPCQINLDTVSGIYCGNRHLFQTFYFDTDYIIKINENNKNVDLTFALFSGNIKNGKNTLQLVQGCSKGANFDECNMLKKGWYTIMINASRLAVNQFSEISIEYSRPTKIIKKQYHRPKFAANIDSLVNSNKALTWQNNYGSKTFPLYQKEYKVPVVNICGLDTPFSKHHIVPSCLPKNHQVLYYVFTLAKTSFVKINATGFNGSDKTLITAKLFDFDVRTDSNLLKTKSPLQTCNYDASLMEFCLLKAGKYSLIIFFNNPSGQLYEVSPILWVDSVGISRFDFAKKAYDFDLIAPDSKWHGGKTNDKHPKDTTLNPSHDFIFCTTGSAISDHKYNAAFYNNFEAGEYSKYIYPNDSNTKLYQLDSIYFKENGKSYFLYGPSRRNLWYTFRTKGTGSIQIKLNTDASKKDQVYYHLFQGNDNGRLHFDSLILTGKIDSIFSKHLAFSQSELTYNLNPCKDSLYQRFYIMVDLQNQFTTNAYAMSKPKFNIPLDIEIKFNPLQSNPNPYDYYSNANVINGLNQKNKPYTTVNLSANTDYYGDTSYFQNLSFDNSDSNQCLGNNIPSKGSMWYKFKIDKTGYLKQIIKRYNPKQIGGYESFSFPDFSKGDKPVFLYKALIPGDSLNGLVNIPINYSNNGIDIVGTSCVSPGWYYINISNCDYCYTNFIIPKLNFIFHSGDYCNEAIETNINTFTKYTSTALIDCHTMGNDYGEDGTDLGCLYGPTGYKSTWYKVNYNDTSKADIEFLINEKTTVTDNQIRFRTYYGNCNALTAAPCNNNVSTSFTLNCLRKGTIWVQAVSPIQAKGELELWVTAKKNTDPNCNPNNYFKPVANFTYNHLCPSNIILFNNLSTKGDSIKYTWDFGYNALTSNLINPNITYPLDSIDRFFRVKLKVENITRFVFDTISFVVKVNKTPPFKFLPNDTSICQNQKINISSSSIIGKKLWSTGDTSNSITVSNADRYILQISHLGCIYLDTFNLSINPLPQINLSDTIICNYNKIKKYAPMGMLSYLWNDGTTSRISDSLSIGQYWCSIKDFNQCSQIDTFSVIPSLKIPDILDADTQLCENNFSISLKANINGGKFYGNSIIDSIGRINPSSHTQINNLIFYKIIDQYNCTYIDSSLVSIHKLPNSTINAAGPFCINQSTQMISPYQSGGYFWKNAYIDSLGNFKPSQSSIGLNKIKYTIIDANLCINTDSILVKVNALPDASLVSSGPFCANDTLKNILAKTNYGGVFQKESYLRTNGIFNPKFANTAYPNKVVYTYTDANSCTSKDSIYIDVNPIPNAAIKPVNDICANAMPINLEGLLNKGGIFKTDVFVDKSGKFDPSKSNIGRNWIHYTFTDLKGCINTDSIIVKVDSVPKVKLLKQGPFCKNAGIISLKLPISNSGKYLADTYIDTLGNFNPLKANIGLNKIIYHFTDSKSCFGSDSSEIQVDTIPFAKISASGPFCLNSKIQTIKEPNAIGWFLPSSLIDSLGIFNPQKGKRGINPIIFYVKDQNNCINSDTLSIWLDTIPDASIKNEGPFCANHNSIKVEPIFNKNGKFWKNSFIDSTGLFDPSKAIFGANEIKYTFIDKNKCSNTDSIDIWIDSIPFAKIKPSGPFCENIVTQKINTIGDFIGSFKNTAYIDNIGNFNPRIAKKGNHKIVYTIIDGKKCKSADSIIIKVDSIPNAQIINPGPLCANYQALQIIPKVNKGGSFMTSSFLDINGNFDVSKANIGFNKIKYNFKDGNNCSNTDSIYIRIDSIPIVKLDPMGPFCKNDQNQSIKLSRGTLGNYKTSDIIIGNNIYPKLAQKASYKIVYISKNNMGCIGSDSIIIKIDSIPNAQIQSAGPFCANAGKQVLIPKYNKGGKFLATNFLNENGDFYPDKVKKGIVKAFYTFTDLNRCKNTDSISIRVDSIPNASIQLAGPFCNNDNNTIIYPKYNFGGKFITQKYISESGVFSPQLANVGYNKIYYQFEDNHQCKNKDSISVLIHPIPQFNYDFNPKSGCEILDVQFNSDYKYKIQWDFGIYGSSTSKAFSKSFTKGNIPFKVIVTDTNLCSNTKSDLIKVFEKPKAKFEFSPKIIFNDNPKVVFKDYSFSDIISWNWNLGDGMQMSIPDFDYIYQDTGIYQVQLIVENTSNCKDTANETLHILEKFTLYVPNAFTVNYDQLNEKFKIVGTGIREIELMVFNRWGEILYKGIPEWDGVYKDQLVQMGTYPFILKAVDYQNQLHTYKGIIHVLR